MSDSFIEIPEPIDPHLRRWMVFVDGENFTSRAQQVAKDQKVSLPEGPFHLRDTFIWVPDFMGTRAMQSAEGLSVPLQPHALRAHYYTSVVGDEEKISGVKNDLFRIGFTPKVFKKSKTRGSKAVDIALATDMLSHGYRDNYDVAVLFAGDGDYVPLVEEIKRIGKVVYISFFRGSGLNNELALASDTCLYIDKFFLGKWREHLNVS
jgi:hypothetical protein